MRKQKEQETIEGKPRSEEDKEVLQVLEYIFNDKAQRDDYARADGFSWRTAACAEPTLEKEGVAEENYNPPSPLNCSGLWGK